MTEQRTKEEKRKRKKKKEKTTPNVLRTRQREMVEMPGSGVLSRHLHSEESRQKNL